MTTEENSSKSQIACSISTGSKFPVADRLPIAFKLPEKEYTFTNVQHDTSLSIYNNSPSGPITGLSTQTAQTWTMVHIEDSIVTIKNKSTGSYVVPSTMDTQPGVSLVGSSRPYKWAVKNYAGTKNKYSFVTRDGEYTWYLTSNGDYAVVVLENMTNDTDDASVWVMAEPDNQPK